MRSDIDRLMQEFNLDWIVVLGGEGPNTYRDYLTRRAKAGGSIFKKRGEKAIFITGQMELDEAAKSGLTIMTGHDFGYADLYKQFGDQPAVLRREMFLQQFRKLGVTGRVGFYGTPDLNQALAGILALQDSTLGIQIVVGGEEAELFQKAYETKDPEEIAALREAGELTGQVVRRAWDFLAGHYAERDEIGARVVDASGVPLTIGAVRRYIRQQEVELGLEDSEGFIFAQGHDAGMPHSVGEDSDVLQVGRSIVFDIFPQGETGYFHDMTRTWCLGRAEPQVQAAYDDVMGIFRDVMGALKVGEPTAKYQIMTLDYFEARGHDTQRSKPGTLDGYVHSLGHGLGLNVHEAPGFGEKSKQVLQPGNVVTIEPGLYYPDRGFGVRVEDTVYFDEAGTLHTLTQFPYDLVVPLRTKS